jgi:hypothetical protein
VLSVGHLIDAARSRTGLRDLGDFDVEPLERLIESVNEESHLSSFGELAFPEVLIRPLMNRLEIEEWYSRHPEIDDEQIVAPLFVLGMPRTGSTLLGYLLALDPNTRSFRQWEAEKPCPPPIAGDDQDPRIAEADARHEAFMQRCPHLVSMAPWAGSSGPVECGDIFYMSFQTAYFDMYVHCPSYISWFYDAARDHSAVYRYHRRALKLLQWRCPPKRWVLRGPGHSIMVNSLNAAYPDARFIMTHRDPTKVIPSVAHLITTVRADFLIDPLKSFMGNELMREWDMAMQRLLRFRANNESRFKDVHHADIIQDSLQEITAIYRWLDWPESEQFRADVIAWRKGNPPGDNRFEVADFNLDLAEITRRFAYYLERFPPRTLKAKSVPSPSVTTATVMPATCEAR